MRFAPSLALVSLAVALAACGPSGNNISIPGVGSISTSGDGSVTTVKGADGSTLQFGDNATAAAAALPGFLSLMPGAKVTASIAAPDANNDRKTGSVAFDTNASVADVLAFYKDKAKAAGLEEGLNMSDKDGSTFMAEKDKQMLQVIVSKGSDATNVLLTWSEPK